MKFTARENGSLLEFLQGRFPQASKTTLRNMLRHGRVAVDGRTALRGDMRVVAGQQVEIEHATKGAGERAGMGARTGQASARTRAGRASRPPGRILYRDEHLIAVEKPAGILSVARDPALDDTFYRRMNEYVRGSSNERERIFIVHRLDRQASGVMLFALSQEIQESLQRNWARTEKRYWALVEGRLPREADTIRSWLRETRAHRVFSGAAGPGAKHAITHYRVLRTSSTHSLLEVEIETGRKNQIRVHLAEMGCPVVGDRKYGARTNPLRRLGLHAFLLAFTHPATGERIKLRLPLPQAFRVG
jgi:23S rRNA pseudouridine1911/1915/1917 synthase